VIIMLQQWAPRDAGQHRLARGIEITDDTSREFAVDITELI
jgi:hypothetical protein